ncbi:hypothetical protein Trydic_g5435 [Trypoxylus dichotomus]
MPEYKSHPVNVKAEEPALGVIVKVNTNQWKQKKLQHWWKHISNQKFKTDLLVPCWYGEFKRGQIGLSDDPRTGAPKAIVTLEHVDAVCKIIDEDRSVTYHEIEVDTLEDAVYRKASHINRYQNAQSQHHPAQVQRVAKSLVSRFQRLADADHIRTESNEIKRILRTNGFTTNTIRKGSQRTLPLMILWKPVRKNGQILGAKGVYEMFCKNCNLSYIGSTNSKISVKREEHKITVRGGYTTSALAQHVLMAGHKINFKSTNTIGMSEHLSPRIIREAIEIEKRPKYLNKRDDALRLPLDQQNNYSDALALTVTGTPSPVGCRACAQAQRGDIKDTTKQGALVHLSSQAEQKRPEKDE